MSYGYDEVLQRLAGHLRSKCAPGTDLNEKANLIEDIGLDSNGVLEMLMEIEDEFDISIPMNQLVDVHTLGELAHRIENISKQ